MNKIWIFLAREGRHSTFHIFSMACLLMGVFVIYSASDMGPFMPLLVAIGIYFLVFAAILQGLYWAVSVLRMVAAKKAGLRNKDLMRLVA